MRLLPFIASMGNARHDIIKAIEFFVSHSDAKQFVSAGIELGRIQELANRLANTCHLAGDALWEDSQAGKQAGK